MFRLSALVKPLAGFMVLAIIMGVIGNLCAAFITVLGGYAILDALNISTEISMLTAFILAGVFALLRGILRYAEQSSNHYIAFKLLALIRDRVFVALRRLCPAKLEGKDKGNLISIITSDIELLEVFYAHTISPIAIAIIFCVVMVVFISMYSIVLGMIALAAYVTVGVIIPIAVSKISGSDGENFRKNQVSSAHLFLTVCTEFLSLFNSAAAKSVQMKCRKNRGSAKNRKSNEAENRHKYGCYKHGYFCV